jgi:hypothetical protein
VPDWNPKENWQNNPQYMNFDHKWSEFTEKEFKNELKKLGVIYE